MDRYYEVFVEGSSDKDVVIKRTYMEALEEAHLLERVEKDGCPVCINLVTKKMLYYNGEEL